MGLTIFQVDAFTDRPFAGNPAGVCVLPGARDERWMQNVAQEMNLSETAFLRRQGDGYQLRWFTPAVEVDLCGHATLASYAMSQRLPHAKVILFSDAGHAFLFQHAQEFGHEVLRFLR